MEHMSSAHKIVERSTVLPAPKSRVFALLGELRTLQYIAAPYIYFAPVDAANGLRWRAGETFVFRTKLFGIIPFGQHTIRVVAFDPNRIYTNEGNRHVPVWNHEIILRELDGGRTSYTDRVELFAGWKTPFVYAWATLFYAHRQRKWRKLLAK